MVECKDSKCPIHGSLRTRGAVFEGRVVSAKTRKTVVVEIPRLHRVRKYERLEKRKSKLHAYLPDCMKVKEGEMVRVAECRKLSKTKSHVVVKE
jgi:small subunit ribosomal protein S17